MVQTLLAPFQCLPFDEIDATYYAKLRHELEIRGEVIVGYTRDRPSVLNYSDKPVCILIHRRFAVEYFIVRIPCLQQSNGLGGCKLNKFANAKSSGMECHFVSALA
jgi:hypothetical protein